MRRIIILLACTTAMLAMALPAVAGPFTDVPTDHWAYDAIDKLQAEGFVEGYPDGTFRGNRSFTRYEMAMVVARIWDRLVDELESLPMPDMSNYATQADLEDVVNMVNDLLAEFRDELDALGIRVGDLESRMSGIESRLSNLEAGLGNVTVFGNLRLRIEDIITNDYERYGGFLNPAGAGQYAGIIAGTPGSNPGEMFEVEQWVDLGFKAKPSDFLDVFLLLRHRSSYLDAGSSSLTLGINAAYVKADMMKLMGWDPTSLFDRFSLTVGRTKNRFGVFGLAFENFFQARPGLLMELGGDRLELRAFLARSILNGEQEGLGIARAAYSFGDSSHGICGVPCGDGCEPFATIGFNYLGTGVGNEQGMGADLDTKLLNDIYLNRLRVEYFQLTQDQQGFDVGSYGDAYEASLIAWVDLYNDGNTVVSAAYADIGLVPGFSSIDNNPFEQYDALFTGIGGNINYNFDTALNPFPSNFIGGGMRLEHTWWDVVHTMLTFYDGTNQDEEDLPVVIRLHIRYPLSAASDIALEYIHSGIDALTLAKLRGEFLVRF